MTRPLPHLPLSPLTLDAVQATAVILVTGEPDTATAASNEAQLANLDLAVRHLAAAVDRAEERDALVRYVLEVAAGACLWVQALEGGGRST